MVLKGTSVFFTRVVRALRIFGTASALSALFLLFGESAVFASEPAVRTISPNNDGVQDTLEIPLQIKEKRYIKEWALVIYDNNGNVVRTITNKRRNQEKLTFLSFFKNLAKPKSNVEVPAVVVWNGLLGDEASRLGLVPGEVAPDGHYFYVFSASDDNGNTGTSAKYEVIVDTTAPRLVLEPLTAEQKTFGEGAKSVLRIQQTASTEREWQARIVDQAGNAVRSYSWKDAAPPEVLEWRGEDDAARMVPDGVYAYEIVGTDAAGNKTEARISNIIFSAEKPTVAVSIQGSRYFSPNGDSVLDTISFNLDIQSPTSGINSLTDWKVTIRSEEGAAVFETGGHTAPPAVLVFDGKGKDGIVLPEGAYKAVVTARYSNGYESPEVFSPAFFLDVSAPAARVSLEETVFNGSRTLVLHQSISKPEPAYLADAKTVWQAQIVGEDGTCVKQFDFGTQLLQSVSWDGTTDDGSFASDGTYRYELTGVDVSGNSARVLSQAFVLDTSRTELMLTVSPHAFSPNADGVQDELLVRTSAKASSGIESYTIAILEETGAAARIFSGAGAPPDVLVWDGKKANGTVCKDGTYTVTFSTVAHSGTEARAEPQQFVIDTELPALEIAVPYTSVSPDGLSPEVSRQQVLPIHIQRSSQEKKWTAQVLDERGTVVKDFVWQNGEEKMALEPFVWDISDNNGNTVSNGIYRIQVSVQDEAGNKTERTIQNIRVDSREAKAYITTSETDGISPNGDGFKDVQRFTIHTTLQEGIADWQFSVVDFDGNPVRTWAAKDTGALPQSVEWDGLTNEGRTAEGLFAGSLVIQYEKGNTVRTSTAPFVSTVLPPELSVSSSANPEKGTFFSPDNDGNEDELSLSLGCATKARIQEWSLVVKDSRNDSVFWKTGGKSLAPSGDLGDVFAATGISLYETTILWDGRGNDGDIVMSAEDYPFEFVVKDTLGMENTFSGIIPVDVLVVLDGGRLKMQVPSIVFRGDAADFGLTGELDSNGKIIRRSSLTEDQRANNIRVLSRIAQILKKFNSYNVTIVGHANPMSAYNGNEAENPEENVDGSWGRALRPLSLERAQYVKNWLVTEGKISASRLKAEGKGGIETITDPTNLQTRWKNRRVEFILEK